MAFEFDFNEMYAAASLYLSKRLRVIRLQGIWTDGRCTCGDAQCAVCESSQRPAGKHPRGKARGACCGDEKSEWGVPQMRLKGNRGSS